MFVKTKSERMILTKLRTEEDKKTDETMKKPEIKKKGSTDFVDHDKQILMNVLNTEVRI